MQTHDAGRGGAAPAAALRSQQADLFKCDADAAEERNPCAASPSPPRGHMTRRRPLQAEPGTAAPMAFLYKSKSRKWAPCFGLVLFIYELFFDADAEL